jgi:UDPglucose 6-dehydrogenase
MAAAQAVLAEDLADLAGAAGRLQFVDEAMAAAQGADALLVLTEWKQFHNPDFEALRARLRCPLILDGRNLYDPQALQELGLAYQGVGRRNALAQQHRAGAAAAAQPATVAVDG